MGRQNGADQAAALSHAKTEHASATRTCRTAILAAARPWHRRHGGDPGTILPEARWDGRATRNRLGSAAEVIRNSGFESQPAGQASKDLPQPQL